MEPFTLSLDKPARIKVVSVDGAATATIDVYEARRMLEQSEAKPDAERWQSVIAWLATKLDVTPYSMAENVAISFNNHVVAIVAVLDEERKKKAVLIASSLLSTQESPAITEDGQQS